ncbi:MAG: prolipoprotein diacylglyceryl transferase [Chloroflexota bacterium]
MPSPFPSAISPCAWYGIGIASAILVGFWLALREARRKGLPEDDVYNVGMWGVLAAFLGARLFHVIDNWAYYAANPSAILAVQNGGLAILGGILGGLAGGLLYARRRQLPLAKLLDAAAPALILGQAIGRIGCTINGDAVGAPTNLPWGFVYLNPGAMAPSLGQAYQPTQVYEMLWDLGVFALLWWARKRVRVDGALFLAYISLYSAGKFAISALRQEAIWFLGLQEAQIVSLLVLVIALPALWVLGAKRAAVSA